MENEIMTIKQVTELLQVGETKVRELMQDTEHPLPFFYLSTRTPRFRRRDIEKWIAEKKSV